ncbi:MAG TPA: glucokinase [Allosphingosinicella sp.]|jgi:glucokinase|nr:glucokinase [Allosphingosinicella sp.]
MDIVVGDIGGTHARFALAEIGPGERPRIGEMKRYRTREHEGVASAWRAFERDNGGSLPRAAAMGVAAPIDGDVVYLVNSGWRIDRPALVAELGLADLVLVNDFGAVALAVSVLADAELDYLAGPEGPLPQQGVTTVIGPGTGLGVSMLLRREAGAEILETEAGHTSFAPVDDEAETLADHLQARYGRVSVERVVSGPGLIDIHRFLGGGDWDPLDAGGLWSAAIDGSDPLAARGLDLLVRSFGSAAGDMALAHGSVAVVITGGLSNRIREKLRSPLFSDGFTAKGRYRERMSRLPVRLATYPEPGLLGAALTFERRHPP